MPITNAKDRLLTSNPGTLPDMRGAIADYFQQMSFTSIVKTVVNFTEVETKTTTSFMGVRQPLSAQKIMMKPEGQRAWKWEMIHSYPDLTLRVDEIITFQGQDYRVADRFDWTEYGFVEYHIVQAFQ